MVTSMTPLKTAMRICASESRRTTSVTLRVSERSWPSILMRRMAVMRSPTTE